MAIEKKWIVKEQGNPAAVRALSAELGIDQVLANLLVQRNITTAERAREFFKPDLSKLHDPFLMKDMLMARSSIKNWVMNISLFVQMACWAILLRVFSRPTVTFLKTSPKKLLKGKTFCFPKRIA